MGTPNIHDQWLIGYCYLCVPTLGTKFPQSASSISDLGLMTLDTQQYNLKGAFSSFTLPHLIAPTSISLKKISNFPPSRMLL